MGIRRRISSTPVRHIHSAVYQKKARHDYCYECKEFQSFVLLVVWCIAAMKNAVLIPAPTAASVKATSTAPISAQRRHIMKLYAPRRMAELKRSDRKSTRLNSSH